jgi:hypothetical protein
MTTQDQVQRLKKLPPLTQNVCATCAFLSKADRQLHYEESPGPYKICEATQEYAYWAYAHRCHGNLWAPPLSIRRRFMRWLKG